MQPGIDVEIILKQRLVGAAMIVALAVVLVPMILDGAGLHVIPDIPETPKYVSQTLPKTIRVNHHQLPRPTAQQPVSTHKRPAATVGTAVPENRAGSRPVDGGAAKKTRQWVVQVASFRNRENARVLRRRLRQAGFKVFVQRTGGRGNRAVYRVRIGPEQDRARLKEILERLKQHARLSGYVVTLSN